MKKRFAITFFSGVFFLASTALFAADISSLTGCYKTKDDKTGQIKSVVQIYREGNQLKGKILRLTKDPDAKCTKCRGWRKNKPIKGMNIIWGVKEVGEKSGKILDPSSGKVYTVKLWKRGRYLKVRGYIAFFYRTQTWYPSACK